MLYATTYGLRLWLRADRGITLGGTLNGTGTTPPAVTISGTPTNQIGLHVEIDSVGGGTGLGQATYKWSINNGTSYVATGVLTAAGPVALGTTGVSIGFGVGPYNINNKWDATVAAWADQSGSGNNLIQATASKQPIFILSAQGGRPGVRFDGVDDFMAAAPFTLNQPETVLTVYKNITLTAGEIVFDGEQAGRLAAGADPAQYIISAGTALTYASAVANGVYDRVGHVFNGASSAIRVGGAQVQTGNVGALNAAGFKLGGLATDTLWANIEVAEVLIYASALPAGPLASIEAGQKIWYAL